MKIKNNIALVCAAVICFTGISLSMSQSHVSAEYTFYSVGDMDSDGDVDIADATLILQFYAELMAGLETTFSGDQWSNVDCNGDGSIAIDDATLALEYYAISMAGLTNVSFYDFLVDAGLASPKWELAMFGYLSMAEVGELSYPSGNESVSLIYIDDDDIPELLVNSYSGGSLYSFYNGRCVLVHSWESARSGGFMGYIERSGYFFTYSSAGATYWSLGKQELKSDGSFSLAESIAQSDNSYTHNGKSCSKSELTSINNAFQSSMTSYETYTIDEFINYLSSILL